MQMPIRVLHIVGSMGIGGIQTYLMNLYRTIDRSLVQFDFLIHFPTEQGFEEEIVQMGGRIYYQPKLNFYNMVSYEKKYVAFLREHQEYSIVHIHIRSVSALCAFGAKLEERFVIIHSHSTTNGYGLSAIIKNSMQFPARFLGDYFMGCSQIANEWMFGKRIANSKNCCVLFNGIDVSKFNFSEEKRGNKRREIGIKDNEIIIGNIGRLVEPKNHELLIRAYARAFEINRNLRLVIVGDGPLRQYLVNIAKELCLESRIVFLGNRNDVPELLQAFDIFVMPSKNEGLGIAVIEAQAAGLPCIISDMIPKEAIISKSIIVCRWDSIGEWTKNICEIKPYRDLSSPLLLKKAGYDIRIIGKRLTDFYNLKYKGR